MLVRQINKAAPRPTGRCPANLREADNLERSKHKNKEQNKIAMGYKTNEKPALSSPEQSIVAMLMALPPRFVGHTRSSRLSFYVVISPHCPITFPHKHTPASTSPLQRLLLTSP
ncbi:hypothetical protein RRG08_041062 [Elysia crispata]|uniref:Uncharacterized protein n=1 Tax=Elysia crispata TaxID=231223 RepID=A0AAE0Y8P9_9GAST|nr:hypothetical protein RRG08_041062 [Elysia crispata]